MFNMIFLMKPRCNSRLRGGHKTIVRLLLDNGAYGNARDGHVGKSLRRTSYFGYDDVERIVI